MNEFMMNWWREIQTNGWIDDGWLKKRTHNNRYMYVQIQEFTDKGMNGQSNSWREGEREREGRKWKYILHTSRSCP